MSVPLSANYRLLAIAAVAVSLLLARPAKARPYLFPATPSSAPEVREDYDVARYLAEWKAARLQRSRRLEQPETVNQSSYDVRYYDLDLTFTPATSTVAGTVRMKATVTSGPLSSADLDLYANMVVDAASANGTPVAFSHIADLLTVNLDRAYANGETFDLTVAYHGTPLQGSFGFDVANGRQLIWSLSEPFGARSWWPCKDAPEDKADSVDVRFTVPTGLITASNGVRTQSTDNGSVAVTRWRERYPIATYLVSIASYPYATSTQYYRYAPTDSMPIQFFNFPESVAGVTAVQNKVKDMIAAYATRLGEYPFIAEKYGHAQFLFGGGMEHQTCTSLGAFNEFVVAHELGHQWFGDRVTCRDFHHVWLNEGFASYCEALWAEATGGTAAYFSDINANKFFGPGSVYVPDVSDEGRIFDSNLSYNKASWVLHMLRRILGDATFFAALRQYTIDHGYSTATTEDFRDVCEAVSGRNLHAFFQQWIYGEYYPVYGFGWTSAPSGGGYDVTLTLDQTQGGQLFTMPVDVRIATGAGDVNVVVPDSLASQTFTLHVASTPTAVAIDPDGWILKTFQQQVADPTFEKSLLLVNGVDWSNYGTEITSAYTDRAFSGDYAFDFWDHFAAPAGGYPAALPAPLGHGAVPAEVLGHYRNVIWVGNNFNGDLASWYDTPILSYLQHGGNVLLMTRMGDQFLGDSLRSYLGITFAAGTTLSDCIATRPGLTSMAATNQTLCAVFDTVRTRSDTQLLFKVHNGYTPERGIGVLRQPTGGAGRRPKGGRFIYFSGRPYRWNHLQLRGNVMTMLNAYFAEPLGGVAVNPPEIAAHAALAITGPNPFHLATALRVTLPAAGEARLDVLDVGGRRVRTLFAGRMLAGAREFSWDGRDEGGRMLATGVYWARLDTPRETRGLKLLHVR
jgi:hypothetical protein